MAAPLYLFTGPEFGERNEAVDAVKSALKKKFGEIDEYLYYAAETDFSEVMTALQSESLFVPASCVVLRGAELLKNKSDVAMLESWVSSSPDGSNVLVLVSDEISVDSKVEKLVPKENKKIFWEMFENQKPEWLKKFFKKSGYILGNEACEAILELVENNTESLKSECSAFFLCFPEGHEITVADVEKMLSHNREESAFTLFDAMSDYTISAEKRLENSLAILQKIRLSKNSQPVMLIGGLTSCFRKLSLWHKIHSGGAYLDDFALKTKGFTSKKARDQYKSAAKVWTPGQVTACLALLASTDAAIRSFGTQFEETQLQMMLFSIIMKNGAFISEYQTA